MFESHDKIVPAFLEIEKGTVYDNDSCAFEKKFTFKSLSMADHKYHKFKFIILSDGEQMNFCSGQLDALCKTYGSLTDFGHLTDHKLGAFQRSSGDRRIRKTSAQDFFGSPNKTMGHWIKGHMLMHAWLVKSSIKKAWCVWAFPQFSRAAEQTHQSDLIMSASTFLQWKRAKTKLYSSPLMLLKPEPAIKWMFHSVLIAIETRSKSCWRAVNIFFSQTHFGEGCMGSGSNSSNTPGGIEYNISPEASAQHVASLHVVDSFQHYRQEKHSELWILTCLHGSAVAPNKGVLTWQCMAC